MRYYYTDPLAAAWMRENYGMLYTNASGLELCWCNEFNCFHLPDTATLSDQFDGKHYIHQDSLALLEPQDGDFVAYEWATHGCTFAGYSKIAWEDCANPQIIQRNGKAFHWPEVEA